MKVGIVGAGIVGLAVARLLARAGVTVTVFEKENAVGQHQTGHNSGVVHAGIYYAPGSAKATMTRRGVALLKEYCQEKHLTYDERGKLVVARDEREITKLRELERRATANKVPGLRWLEAAELREFEPGIAGQAALLSPSTAIVDYPAIARAYDDDVTASGGQILLSAKADQIYRAHGGGVSVVAKGTAYHVDRLVICAGLQADLLARRIGDGKAPEIIPFRGEYLRLRPRARDRVKRLIYPVPDPKYPFLGVHLTPRVNGESDLGPNAVLALAREGYRRRDIEPSEIIRLGNSGSFWAMARKNWRAGVREMRGSLSRGAFLAEARTYLPWLTSADVMPAPAGVRAQAVDADGSLVEDFRITRAADVVVVRNAPSPAATASLAIAEHIVGRLELRLPAPAASAGSPLGARPEGGERVRHHEFARREPVHSRGPPATGGGPDDIGRRLDHPAPRQDPLQVRGRHRVAERGRVHVAQLGDGERLRREREPDIGVGKLSPQPLPCRPDDGPVVERGRRQFVDRMPGRVGRQPRARGGRHQCQVGRGEDASARITRGVAAGLQLLKMGNFRNVHLRGEMP